jgi:hypothetical protein
MATCKDCKFYENECESHSQQKMMGLQPSLEICEIFYQKQWLIDANELLDEMHSYDERQKTDVWLTSDIEYLLNEQPTVDAVEVAHGRWILKETCGKHTEKFHCSVCNKVPKSLCTETYCPNCGAKMDGGNENG